MNCISAVAIGKLIEAHIEHDEKKFLSYANFIAEAYEEHGDKRSARIIRKKIDGTYKNESKVVALDFPQKDWIKIHIEATGQDTVARLKLGGIGVSDLICAVLYDIPKDLKPFPFFSKVRFCGKELEFYYGSNGNLIQKDYRPYDFWFGKEEKS